MAIRIKLNHNSIKSLKSRDKRYTVTVEGNQGLMLRVNPSGKIDFLYRYQLKGKRRSMKIGRYPDKPLKELNLLYSEAAKNVGNGIDPLEIRQHDSDIDDPTLAEITELYFKNQANKLRTSTRNEYLRIANKYILKKWPNIPHLAQIKISALRRRDVKLLIDYIAYEMPNTYRNTTKLGAPIQANRCRAVLSAICSYALELEYLENHPVLGTTKPGIEKVAERCLDMEEIKILVNVLHQSARITRDFIMLGLYTGQRISQIAGLRNDWIKEDGWVYFPANIMKAKRSHKVFLCPSALDIIKNRINDKLTTEYIFPGSKENSHINPHLIKKRLSRLQRRLREAGIKEPFSFHDFRRTLNTNLSSLGFAGIGDIILSHVKPGVTSKHYQKYGFEPEIIKALTVWCIEIQKMME